MAGHVGESSAEVRRKPQPFHFGCRAERARCREDRLDLRRSHRLGLREPFPEQREVGLVARDEIGGDQVVLALEVIIQRALGEAGPGGDLVDADAADAFICRTARSPPGRCARGSARRVWAYGVCIPTSEYTQFATAPTFGIRPTANAGDRIMSEPILLDIDDEIARITLNRPAQLNALELRADRPADGGARPHRGRCRGARRDPDRRAASAPSRRVPTSQEFSDSVKQGAGRRGARLRPPRHRR